MWANKKLNKKVLRHVEAKSGANFLASCALMHGVLATSSDQYVHSCLNPYIRDWCFILHVCIATVKVI